MYSASRACTTSSSIAASPPPADPPCHGPPRAGSRLHGRRLRASVRPAGRVLHDHRPRAHEHHAPRWGRRTGIDSATRHLEPEPPRRGRKRPGLPARAAGPAGPRGGVAAASFAIAEPGRCPTRSRVPFRCSPRPAAAPGVHRNSASMCWPPMPRDLSCRRRARDAGPARGDRARRRVRGQAPLREAPGRARRGRGHPGGGGSTAARRAPRRAARDDGERPRPAAARPSTRRADEPLALSRAGADCRGRRRAGGRHGARSDRLRHVFRRATSRLRRDSSASTSMPGSSTRNALRRSHCSARRARVCGRFLRATWRATAAATGAAAAASAREQALAAIVARMQRTWSF